MRAVVQRVKEAGVKVDNKIVGRISKGLLVFLGVGEEDSEIDLNYLVHKILGLRIFQDENDKMNLSVLDIDGEILVISQFTLYGDVRKGKRPSFIKSAHPEIGNRFYEEFITKINESGVKVESGKFGAHMDIDLINDGPVTILIDSNKDF
jgi:D-tyrosyl-tRNA(Tyr) deacylase